MFEGFPYTNFHELNLDWIIKIAKDFLDQYTNIQQTITQGLEDLDTKAQQLQALLDAWYEEHSEDIANQLAEALQDLNDWYTQHQGYLDQYLTDSIAAFNTAAETKAAETIESIPDDYTALSDEVQEIHNALIDRTCNEYTLKTTQSIDSIASTLTSMWVGATFFVGGNYFNLKDTLITSISFVSQETGTFDIYIFYEDNIANIDANTKYEKIASIEVTETGLHTYPVNVYVPLNAIIAFRSPTRSASYSSSPSNADQAFYSIPVATLTPTGLTNATYGIGLEYKKLNTGFRSCFANPIPQIQYVASPYSLSCNQFTFYYSFGHGTRVRQIPVTGIQAESEFSLSNVRYYFINANDNLIHVYTQNELNASIPDNSVYIGYTEGSQFDLALPILKINNITYKKSSIDKLPFDGKKYSILGDSVSTYSGYIPSGYVSYYPNVWFTGGKNKTWWGQVETKAGFNLEVDNAYSGSFVTNYEGNGTISMVNRCEDLGTDPDYIFFFGGYNDFEGQKALGTFEKKASYLNGDLSKFADAYCYILQKILTKYPRAKVYCLSVPAQKKSNWNQYVDENNGAYYKSEMNALIKEICENFKVNFVDTMAAYPLSSLQYYAGDWNSGAGLHPNESGMTRIAEKVITALGI